MLYLAGLTFSEAGCSEATCDDADDEDDGGLMEWLTGSEVGMLSVEGWTSVTVTLSDWDDSCSALHKTN